MGSGIRTRTIAQLYLDQDHPRRAAEILKELLQQDPGNAELLAMLEHANQSSQVSDSASENEDTIAPVSESPPAFVQEEPAQVPATPVGRLTALRERATDLGAEVVEQVATTAIERLTDVLARVRERRRR